MQMLETFAAVLKTSEFWRKIPRSKYGLICRKNPGNWEHLKPRRFEANSWSFLPRFYGETPSEAKMSSFRRKRSEAFSVGAINKINGRLVRPEQKNKGT